MPRQASAARSFSANGSTRALIQPPPDLNKLERQEFTALVLGAPPNHFLPSDLPLLAAYAKAIVEERIAAGELAAALCRRWQALALAGDLAGQDPGGDDPGAHAGAQSRRSRAVEVARGEGADQLLFEAGFGGAAR